MTETSKPIAHATTRLRVALAAVITPLRHPLLLAKQLGTLDLLAGGRIVVQPTVSWSRGEYDALGVPFEQRGRILDEQLAAMHAAWTAPPQSPSRHEGEHFTYGDVWVEPRRGLQPAMWFGGQRLHDVLIDRIVRYGHGFHPFGTPTADELTRLTAAMTAAGRSMDELELIGGIRGRFTNPELRRLLEGLEPQDLLRPEELAALVSCLDGIAEDYRLGHGYGQPYVTEVSLRADIFGMTADVPDVESRDLSSVVWILQGAAVMPQTLLRRWFELLSPQQVVMAYGMTENLGLAALRGDEWLAHPGSVGRGFRDTEIRIADDHGNPVGPGEFGEIYLRAPMTGGYRYIGGAAPLPTTADGFTSAGDLGHLDAEGYLYIADRRTDMIVSGGANVFPAEVESALIDHPGIADVVVIGLTDERWGRRVHAVLEAGAPLTEAEVIAFAKGRLAGYKVPKTVEFVDAIPRSAATKVNRSALAAEREG